MDRTSHWNTVYTTKDSKTVSWYQPHLERSLDLIRMTSPHKEAAIIDIGGGASTLVDDLVADGYHNVTVLDVSSAALACTKHRLGDMANTVHWIEGDVTQVQLAPYQYEVWHDRAVFHFLTAAEDRHAYLERLLGSVKPGAHIIMATFGPEGPLKCSGLDTMRYSPDALCSELGPAFQLLHALDEHHATPTGKVQHFIYCCFQRRGSNESGI